MQKLKYIFILEKHNKIQIFFKRYTFLILVSCIHIFMWYQLQTFTTFKYCLVIGNLLLRHQSRSFLPKLVKETSIPWLTFSFNNFMVFWLKVPKLLQLISNDCDKTYSVCQSVRSTVWDMWFSCWIFKIDRWNLHNRFLRYMQIFTFDFVYWSCLKRH